MRAGSRARAARARPGPSARRSRPGRRQRAPPLRDRPRGCAARADRSRGRRAGRDRPRSGCTCAGSRLIITAGLWTPSARYSPTASPGPPESPVSAAARLVPSNSAPSAGAPARSASVGARSSCETGAWTRRAARRGPRTISGTREEPSRNDILYQRPRSPSSSPWSAVNTTSVLLGEARGGERREHLADALVEVADRRVVAVPRVPHLAVAERAAIEADHRAQAQAVRIGLVLRNRPDRGQVDRVARRRDPSSAAGSPRGRAGS